MPKSSFLTESDINRTMLGGSLRGVKTKGTLDQSKES